MPGPVYYSRVEIPGDGVTTQHEFNFAGGYIDRAHVKAQVTSALGVVTPVAIVDAMFVSDYVIDLGVAAPVGSTLLIYRETPRDAPIVDFAGGSRITEANLDTMTRQAIFAVAEAFDLGGYLAVLDLLAEAAAFASAASGAAADAAVEANAAEASATTAAAAAANAAMVTGAAISNLLAADNTWTGDNVFREPVIVEKEAGIECELGVRSFSGGPPVLHGYYANGTKLAPTPVTGGQMVLGIGARGWLGAAYAAHSTAAIHMVSTETHSATAQGTDFRILVTPIGKTHADRKTAVTYYAPATGLRARMRMHGTDNERTWFQTDEAGHNSSLTVVPNGDNLAANVQARDSDTADFHRVYLSSSAADGARIVSDAGGSDSPQDLKVTVGTTDCVTHHAAGTVTHHAGTKLGADAPILRVKKITGTTAATEGGTTSVAHGLTASRIRAIQVVVRTTAAPDEAIPPGFTANAGRQYDAYAGTSNVAVINHVTNSENILSAGFTALITYEPAA
jgi:hypothetical protein